MNWDPEVLKKFCNTGHFKLLNQSRAELKDKPLDRDPVTRTLKSQARHHKGIVQKVSRPPSNRPVSKETTFIEREYSNFYPNTKDRLN